MLYLFSLNCKWQRLFTRKYRQSDKTATDIYTEDKNAWTKAYATDGSGPVVLQPIGPTTQ